MARYNGNNNMDSAKNLAIERAKYNLEAWGPIPPEQVVDFNFAERNRYGRINQNRNAIVPRPEFLKSIDFQYPDQSGILLMNFVADAFSDMKKRLKRACRLGIIGTDHPFIPTIEVYRAHTSAIQMYKEHMQFVMSKYNNEYLPSIQDHTPVLNFDHYWRNLINFCKMMGPQFPITFTAWHRSKYSSIFTSGLALDIAGLPIHDDSPKYDLFISSEEWSYYSNVAKYHGFSISHNAPWVLVADLQSPAMLEYIRSYGFANENQVFAAQYQQTTRFEVELLKSLLVDSYNNFALGYPYHRKMSFCDSFKRFNCLTSKIRMRETTRLGTVNVNTKNSTFYVLYAMIRNEEEGSPFKEADLKRVTSKVKYFYRTLGQEETMRYLNEQYRSLYKFKRGTAYDHKQRSQLRRELEEAEVLMDDMIEPIGQSPTGVPLVDPTVGTTQTTTGGGGGGGGMSGGGGGSGGY